MTKVNLRSIIRHNVENAIYEDVGEGDVTSNLLPEDTPITANIVCREPCILAGRAWFEESFHYLDKNIQIEWFFDDSDPINKGDILAVLRGPANKILTAERTALNFLQLLSGVATNTHQYVCATKGKAVVLDTRKTLPGLRYAQKYAVKCGGGQNHRFGLFDAFLIKENHIKAQGSILEAVKLARQLNPELKIEVEVETIDELKEAIIANPDVIMLDNFDVLMMKQAVLLNSNTIIKLEASGNISLENIEEIANTGVDYISVGRLTKSVEAVDLSLLIV